jgi:hypothetical protein
LARTLHKSHSPIANREQLTTVTTLHRKLRTLASILAVATSATFAQAQVTIAQWTFETSIPDTGGPLSPEVGSGIATSNTGGTFSNPAGWGSTESWSSTGWNVGEYFQFQISTVGLQGLQVYFQQTGSNTGPANWNLQYSIDGLSFTTFGSYAITNDGWNTTLTPAASEKSFDLTAVGVVNDAATVFIRMTVADTVSINGGTVAGTGTARIDNVTFTAVPEPSTYAAIAGVLALGLAFWHRRRKA